MNKFSKAGFKILTVLVLILYLPSCFVYVISPSSWWPIGLLGIGFCYLWFLLLLLLFVWLFLHKETALFILLLLLAGWPVMKNVVAIHFHKPFAIQKNQGSIRVIQWNCNGFKGVDPGFPNLVSERFKAVAFLKEYAPDIICLQDFGNQGVHRKIYSNISLLRDTLGYHFFVFAPHYHSVKPWGESRSGIAIFSKFPIIDSGNIYYPGKKNPESILWADLQVNGTILRIATTHFQSMHLSADTTDDPPDPYQKEDSMTINHSSTIDKIRYFQKYHVKQANLIKNFVDTCRKPLILGADLNSVPSSYVYHLVKGDITDAFISKGSGLGRSFHSRQPALRIDYLFHNEFLQTEQADIFRISFSDHDPLIMDIKLR